MKTLHVAQNFYDNIYAFSQKESKQIINTVKLILEDPSHNSLRCHKLIRTKHDGLVSYSVNKDIRIIAYEPTPSSCFLLKFDRHDAAYMWAQTVNPQLKSDGNIQLIRTIENLNVVDEELDSQPSSECGFVDLLPQRSAGNSYLFDPLDSKALAEKGYTPIYIDLMRRIGSESDLTFLLDKIPESVGERMINDLCEIQGAATSMDLEDTLVNFKHISSGTELDAWMADLKEALKQPFEKWRTFLHPNQRKVVMRNSNGPIKVTGSAGTGKTVVGIHRAKFLLENSFYSKAMMLTYNRTLMNNLKRVAMPFFGRFGLSDRIKVATFHGYVGGLLKSRGYRIPHCAEVTSKEFLSYATRTIPLKHLSSGWNESIIDFAYREIRDVIASQNIDSCSRYMRAPRKGRGKPLSVKQKEEMWNVYELSWQYATEVLKMPWDMLSYYAFQTIEDPIDEALIVDEIQDLKASDLRLIGKIAPKSNQLLLLEDRKQRIYGPGYAMNKLGINVKGRRSAKLYVNYRTTKEIGDAAIQSFASENLELFDKPKSIRSGERPTMLLADSFDSELEGIVKVAKETIDIHGDNLAIIARSNKILWAIEKQFKNEGIKFSRLDKNFAGLLDQGIFLCTMHSVKGLEFKKVLVCGLGNDGHSTYAQEPHNDSTNDRKSLDDNLCYVALSRARDELYLSGRGEFLQRFAASNGSV